MVPPSLSVSSQISVSQTKCVWNAELNSLGVGCGQVTLMLGARGPPFGGVGSPAGLETPRTVASTQRTVLLRLLCHGAIWLLGVRAGTPILSILAAFPSSAWPEMSLSVVTFQPVRRDTVAWGRACPFFSRAGRPHQCLNYAPLPGGRSESCFEAVTCSLFIWKVMSPSTKLAFCYHRTEETGYWATSVVFALRRDWLHKI